jgi:hypothetical protein
MTSDAQSPPGIPANDKQNVFSRIAGVLFAPAETFASIARRPDIVGPLLVIIILGYLNTLMIAPKFDFEALASAQREEMLKRDPNMGEEQLTQMSKMAAGVSKVMLWTLPALLVLWYLLLAGVLLLVFRLFGGEGTFKQALSVSLYAQIPLVILGIITAIVVMARGSFDPITAATLVKSNPAFLADMKTQPVLFTLYSMLDIFTVWTVVLLAFGFSEVARMSKAKAATLVVSLWVVLMLIRLGFAAMGAGMKG